ncbi:hypothetical protein BDF19DRAFT_436552 [Syncephalis fuscata]|nr:hypothetical protein BDF19DRAFT_436552 [Syncephalis fuscata]
MHSLAIRCKRWAYMFIVWVISVVLVGAIVYATRIISRGSRIFSVVYLRMHACIAAKKIQ